MPKSLTQPQVDRYKRDGFAFPAPVLTADEVRWMCSWDTTESDVDAFAAAIAQQLVGDRAPA